MTLPHERTRAVLLMAEQVMGLQPYLHGKSETVRVPRQVLLNLAYTLRHFPTSYDMWVAAKTSPDVFSNPPLRGAPPPST